MLRHIDDYYQLVIADISYYQDGVFTIYSRTNTIVTVILCSLLLLAVHVSSGSSEIVPIKIDTTPGTCDKRTVNFHLKQTNKIWKKAFSFSRWKDKTPVKNKERRRVKKHKKCLLKKSSKKRVQQQRKSKRKRFLKYRNKKIAKTKFRREVTPYNCGVHGWFAIPCYIVQCESRFNKRAKNSHSSAGGWYQIINTTWYAYGGSKNGHYHVAAHASAKEQHIVAKKILRGQGLNAWLCA